MANLRLSQIKVSDSTTILARFTDTLNPLINDSNILITSNVAGVPNPQVLAVSVLNDVLLITTLPLTPATQYLITFQSSSIKFCNKTSTSFLLQDGKTNTSLILGAEDPDDPIRDFLTLPLQNSPYNLNVGDITRDIINSLASNLSRALYDIGQAKNDNYLSRTIYNELQTRGAGPYDRLNEEGAYEIIKVSINAIQGETPATLSFDSFPSEPITLQSVTVTNEVLTPGIGSGTFDGLVLTVTNQPVTALTSVIVSYSDGYKFVYNIDTLGYQINNTTYDQEFASTLYTLNDNQFQLSNNVLTDPGFVMPQGGDTITVTYEYKNLGRIIDETTIVVSQVLSSVRELAPPLLNKFSTMYAPIVNVGGAVAKLGGIQFLDPSANPPFSVTPPAFTKELQFNLGSLPARAGEYAVDYSSGTVYVFGATINDGTGDFPPVMNYQYISSFVNGLDYTYDSDLLELAASPLRSLIGQNAAISFNYEDTLIPGVDFIPQIHQEILDERVDNRINSTNSLYILNAPITNVFRIFNETTGEVYKIQRWNNNTIYYTANNPPAVGSVSMERAVFADVISETLIVDQEIYNNGSVKIFVLSLQNDNIISSSEDVIGSSFNTSASFSRTDIFEKELYFDAQILTVAENINKLSIGQYLVDYRGGIVYVAVSSTQDYDIGTINYKKPIIIPQFPHIISVSSIYNSIDTISGINKRIGLSSFSDGAIIPTSFDVSDERFLNGDTTLPYIVQGNTITVSDDIKNIRGIYDVFNLNNNVNPTNFAEGCSINANVITLVPISLIGNYTIQNGLIINVDFISPGAQIAQVLHVIRKSDNVELFDSNSSFNNFTITLAGDLGSPVAGQDVVVIYTVQLNGSATPVIDYDRGGFFVDYSYISDEILVSYEYGDNLLDFRQNVTMPIGTNYYVTYKVGALRDALLKNFGSLVDLPIMNNFDTTLPRENYRDALVAALQSFTKGPTIPAIKLLVSSISHIEPEIIEAVFQNWSLGLSYLYPNAIGYPNDIQLHPAKFDNGVLITNPGDTVTFPISNNLRLEEGSLETWIIPEWDGLDNDATLTFSNILKSGSVLPSNCIYIGADSHHPIFDSNNEFTLNRTDISSPVGLPSAIFTNSGLFIYYDIGNKLWKVLAKDIVSDGYVYQGSIISSGDVYNVQFIQGLGEINDVLRSGLSKIDFVFNINALDGYNENYDGYYDGYDGYQPGYAFDGIDFMADDEHFIFDFGAGESTNRFSLFKDGKGYLNFRVYDKGNKITKRKNQYQVSSDISAWQAGQAHHVAISWRLASADKRDELHLFVDGFEVPNILKYGGVPCATSSNRFRTVQPFLITEPVPLNVITGNDLYTTIGSNVVYSANIDFQAQGIIAGNSISIMEIGFSTYSIINVYGNTLTLNEPMPATLADARFSVNSFSVIVPNEIDLFSNIAVSIINNGVEAEIPGQRAAIPGYSLSINALNQTVLTILGDANAGDQIAIRTLGINHRRYRDRQFIWGNTSNVLKTQLPPPINLNEVKIVAVILPSVSIGPLNATLISGIFNATLLPNSQPTNSIQGRTLSIKITGENVNFSVPVTVTIIGDNISGPVTEILSFTSPGSENTINKFTQIVSINVLAKPLISSNNTIAVEVKEAYAITYSEGNSIYPVIRFSYKTQTGKTLQGNIGSNIVYDAKGFFPESSVNQSFVINSPPSVAGSYTITSVIDEYHITLNLPIAASFTSGTYDIFNVSIGRSGFQNGFFILEQAGQTNTPFLLNQGFFDFDYSTYLEIAMDPVGSQIAHIGSDIHNRKQAKAVLDEFIIVSKQLTDVRIGETTTTNEETVTTDYMRIKPLVADSNTLMLLNFNSLPFTNDAGFWITANKEYLQSDSSVNASFGKCLVINDKPLVIDNAGLLSTTNGGSIEFWVNPQYDTYNDPNLRYYFDASGSIVENNVSITRGSVKVSNMVDSIISVRLQTDIYNTGTDYFAGGSIAADFQTINLGIPLPYQQTPIKINYIPANLSGDRISIYKDTQGYITFNVQASGQDFQVRRPIFWSSNTWHRILATYQFNRADNLDQIRLFVDGEEMGTVLFGQNIFFGQGVNFGQGFAGVNNSILINDINFRDPVNQFYIGSDYLSANSAYASIDNLRLSNMARQPLLIAGEAIDVNYNSNLSAVFPVVSDAITTYLLDFDAISSETANYSILIDEAYGIFNFTINVIDSFGIVSSNSKIKQILETLVGALKPAQSIATINYV